ncbi:eCIS core domain-containing protein [Reyranella sp.]|uniref:eCIS core domain-containing protein n=1 Tax=Reyranella sp. TaxID=1929291 RepID=UPI003D10E72E
MLAHQRTGGNQAALQLLEKKQGLAESTSATMLQKLAEPATVAPAEVPAVVRDVLRAPGEQLDGLTRAHFEPRFGFDFSAVRVHRDVQAAESARAVHARAYTVGNHIVFGDRRAIEHTGTGQATLAHELAHVIQQNRGGSERPALGGGALERAAESAAAAFAAGRSSIRVSGASAPGLARQPLPGSAEKKPRSLRESLKVSGLTDWALTEEIALISEWLLVNPSSGLEYKQLSDELARLEGEQWRRNQKAEKKQRRQEQIAKVVQAVEAGRIPHWLPVFPFLPSHGLGALMPWDWEFDAAPIMARREGDSIIVQQPINSVKNTRRFAKDVRSIERNVYGNVFSNQGGRLRPDELVGVRLYDEGEKVIVVEARQLLEFARASDRAVYTNIVATALSAGSGAVAGNVARSAATRSFATRLAVNTATGTGLGFATGAGSSAIVDAGYVYSGDISGGQLLSNAWESGKSGAKYGAAFGAAGTVLEAGVSRYTRLRAPPEGAAPRPTPHGTSAGPAPSPTRRTEPVTLYVPGRGAPADAGTLGSAVDSSMAGRLILRDEGGRVISTTRGANGPRAQIADATTLAGEPRLYGPGGQPARQQVRPPVTLLDSAGRPIDLTPPKGGPLIVDLQAGTPAFLQAQTAQIPGSRGIGVEPGNWLLAYQGKYPINPGDLSLALQVARNSPVWPNTPASVTRLDALPHALPWELDPASHIFPRSGAVTMLPDLVTPTAGQAFFPARGGAQPPRAPRLIPFGLEDVPRGPGQLPLQVTPALRLPGGGRIAGVDRIYLRRPFALGLADDVTTAQMGRQINAMLRPGGFVEIRATRATDFNLRRQAAAATDQASVLAREIDGATIYRVRQQDIDAYVRTGEYPPDYGIRQQEMIRDAAADTGGLGAGAYHNVVRIYRGTTQTAR